MSRDPGASAAGAELTLLRLLELLEPGPGAPPALDKESPRALLRELKAVGGDLRAVRRALTGDDSGPELWAVLAELGRDEVLARAAAALAG